MPLLRQWVEGYIDGRDNVPNVPSDWTLLFAGHSLGGAFAMLAATAAEMQGWSKKPDAVIAFGAPRVADVNLSKWWEANGFCEKMLRINVYNDIIHWLPFAADPGQLMGGIFGCATNIGQCLTHPLDI